MAGKQTHILIVDDHPEVMEDALPYYGYQVTVARDGHEALEKIEQKKQNPEAFDLVLLDIMMPQMNGWDVLRRIRSLPGGYSIPVIILSALDSEVDQVSGLKIGADDYVVKPFKITNLLARIEAVLRRSNWQQSEGKTGMTPPLPTLATGARLNSNTASGEGTMLPLTDREREILALLAQGMSNREIAEHLIVSELTVKTHLKNLFKKLNVSSRTQAIVVGLQHQLINN